MSSTSQDAGLEERLRGLILSNAQIAPKSESGTLDGDTRYLPPHLLGASITDQETYMKKAREVELLPKRPPQSSQRGKKRPNQAQRRQISSQTPVPLNPGLGPQGQHQQYQGLSPSSGFPSPRQYKPSLGRNASQPYPHQNSPHLQNLPPAPSFQQPTQIQQQPPSAATYWPQGQHHDPGARGMYKSNSMHQQGRPNHHGPQVLDQSREPITSQSRQLFQPGPYRSQGRMQSLQFDQEQLARQSGFLDALITSVVPEISMSSEENQEKERFRVTIEQICRDVIVSYEKSELGNSTFHSNFVELKGFGSMTSGFATKLSDMDLALLTSHVQPSPASSESPIPRFLEKKFLEMGYGARLLTKTRVPIIKLCQKPTATLMLDLIEEREKWENDAHAENEVEHDEEVLGRTMKDIERVKLISEDPATKKRNKSPAAVYYERIVFFEQKPKQSLGEYCNSARRLLREVGGRDRGLSHSNVLTEGEIIILNDVCKAFVVGLSDKYLGNRLLAYKALSFSKADPTRSQRSLEGVFMQTYGEQIKMAWNNRPLQESTRSSDVGYASLIKNWGALLNKTDMEVSAYDRALHQMLARLRRIPSLQLFFLEQSMHEDSVQYHARAARILEEIKNEEKVEHKDEDHTLEIVVSHYIAGVRPVKIREALKEMTSGTEKLSLQQVFLQHRVLQLANDYEYALEKKVYARRDCAEIKQYIDLLQNGSLIPVSQSSPAASETTATNINDSIEPLINKVRRLPDPTRGRDKYRDHLQFPKATVGIQCDINFSAELGLQNTLLLRCYSVCDPRVKQLVLFVKHWAKVRCINTPYTGTLSSYGYVLMVLHYLINIAQPFVLPNLQQCRPDPPPILPPSEMAAQSICNGHDVRFWRNEEEIARLAKQGQLNSNRDSLGKLLCEFYEYYAQSGPMSTGGRGFDWGREVLSLRTQGGLLTKQEKDWTCAKTVIEKRAETGPAPLSQNSKIRGDAAPAADASATPARKMTIREETKEIRHRYLFAIEDPFEIDHNVARTVTHSGIVSIRDEFRRALRIIKNVGKQVEGNEGGFLDPRMAEEIESRKSNWDDIMEILHGQVGAPESS